MLDDAMREKLSAFMDGELPEEEQKALIEWLKTDEGAKQTWQNYHLIQALMQKNAKECVLTHAAKICHEVNGWEARFNAPAVVHAQSSEYFSDNLQFSAGNDPTI